MLNQCIWLLGLVAYAASLKVGDEGVRPVGRFLFDSAGNMESQWSDTGFKLSLFGTSGQASLEVETVDCGNECNYFVGLKVNCEDFVSREVSEGTTQVSFTIPTQPHQRYDIQLFKKTEASCGDAKGIMKIGNISISGADLELSPSPNVCFNGKRRLLVVGDSITCGYGVDGEYPCTFAAESENVGDSYASMLAAAVDAELHVVAWSGKGVVRNYGDSKQTSSNTMPVLYNRTIPTDATSYWDPASYQPDVVIVTLGTNDYSTQPQPSDEQFVSGMEMFLRQIQSDYPQARVLALCAPMANGNQCQNIGTAATAVKADYLLVSPSTLSGGYGCDGHPNVASQRNISDFVLPTLNALLGINLTA